MYVLVWNIVLGPKIKYYQFTTCCKKIHHLCLKQTIKSFQNYTNISPSEITVNSHTKFVNSHTKIRKNSIFSVERFQFL